MFSFCPGFPERRVSNIKKVKVTVAEEKLYIYGEGSVGIECFISHILSYIDE